MTHALSRVFTGLLATSWLVAYACSGPNDPSRVLTSAAGAAGLGSSGSPGDASAAGGSAGTGDIFAPLCSDVPTTAAGMAPGKGGKCTDSDTQLCYKRCGPLSIGFKSETCSSGLYAEQPGCSFPSGDYSCYRIPPAIDASCPSAMPQAGQACDVAECTLCNVSGNYFDSSGNSKVGYCVCPSNDGGTRRWSCASATAWPCPLGQGCS